MFGVWCSVYTCDGNNGVYVIGINGQDAEVGRPGVGALMGPLPKHSSFFGLTSNWVFRIRHRDYRRRHRRLHRPVVEVLGP